MQLCSFRFSTADIKETTKDIKKITPYSCQYVRWSRLLKRCASIEVEFLNTIWIFVRNFSFQVVSKFQIHNLSVTASLSFRSGYAYCDTEKQSKHIPGEERLFFLEYNSGQ
jgi:hypothetical protein